jgi:hypothetical protein
MMSLNLERPQTLGSRSALRLLALSVECGIIGTDGHSHASMLLCGSMGIKVGVVAVLLKSKRRRHQ